MRRGGSVQRTLPITPPHGIGGPAPHTSHCGGLHTGGEVSHHCSTYNNVFLVPESIKNDSGNVFPNVPPPLSSTCMVDFIDSECTEMMQQK